MCCYKASQAWVKRPAQRMQNAAGDIITMHFDTADRSTHVGKPNQRHDTSTWTCAWQACCALQ